jgi:hypothetical protein
MLNDTPIRSRERPETGLSNPETHFVSKRQVFMIPLIVRMAQVFNSPLLYCKRSGKKKRCFRFFHIFLREIIEV